MMLLCAPMCSYALTSYAPPRELPAELAEAVASVLYCAARCSQELPELATLRTQFASKYGAPFAAAACADATAAASGANARVLALLALAPPPPPLKLARLAEIAAEHGVPWDQTAASSSILGAAPDMVAVAESEAAWEEQPGPHMQRPLPPAAPAPASALVDGWFQPASPDAKKAAPLPVRSPPPLTPLPPRRDVGAGDGDAAEADAQPEEYADAAAAARCAARSAEKAAHAAAAAARLASQLQRTSTPYALPSMASPARTPPPAEGAIPEGDSDAEEPADAADEAADAASADEAADAAAAAQDAADAEALPAAPKSAPGTPAAAAEEAVDELDELTRRFEALKNGRS
jgi:hypothetical protein